MEDKVSVIIPVYNSERFLSESIKSILAQSYKNIEIIGVDDGSTDNSLNLLNQFKDDMIIIPQKNQGLAGALNTGIKKMTGRWFKWFSPDDILYPQAIETLVKKGKETGDNCIVYSNWEIIDEKGKFLRSFSESNYNTLEDLDFNIRLLDGQQINVNTSLIPSKLFLRGCMMRDLKDHNAVDYDFFLRAAILYGTKFKLIEKPLIQYRVHTEQLSHKDISNTLSYLDEVRFEILSKLDNEVKENYLKGLTNYNKQKPFSKKVMGKSLNILSSLLPISIIDKLLIFYLNNIRRGR